ncbi:MAG: glycosyltransferase [Chitinivibrionales bacterium]|nr:glycosyltransferase [Chitinivibrionales bacterium]
MNIAFMNSIPASVWRGGEKWMVNAAAGLHDKGHSVICIGKNNAEWLKRAKHRGVPIKEYPIHMDFDPVMIVRLWCFFRKNSIDVLCCNFEKDVRIGGIAAKLAGIQKIFVRKGLALLYEKFRYRMAYKYIVDEIITPAESIKRTFRKFDWINQDDVHVVPNGVEIPDTSGWDRRYLKKTIDMSDGLPVILAAGRLFSQKGFEYLIEAVEKVNYSGRPVRCAIAGGGDDTPYRSLARKLGIKDRVHFLGERSDLPRLMYGADIFVLSSIDEGLPNVVLEAMSVGTPVVATRAGDAGEIITDSTEGYLVPVGDSSLLAEKITGLLENEDERKRFSKRCIQTVKERYSISVMIDRLNALVTSV